MKKHCSMMLTNWGQQSTDLQWLWTFFWGFQSPPVSDILHDIMVRPAWVGHVTNGKDLPQKYPKRPSKQQKSVLVQTVDPLTFDTTVELRYLVHWSLEYNGYVEMICNSQLFFKKCFNLEISNFQISWSF